MFVSRGFAGRVDTGARQEREFVGESLLPVVPSLRDVLPGGGLRRGTTVEIGVVDDAGRRAAAAMSLLLALLAGPSAAGSWCAVVGVEELGLVAAAEVGIDLARFPLVPGAGEDWAKVVAALVDGFDVVAVAPVRAAAADLHRLAARARHRGAVLLSLGRWPGAEVRLTASRSCWQGLGEGFGRLRARRLEVRTEGRGAAARPRTTTVWLPNREKPVAPLPVIGSVLAPLPGEFAAAGDLPAVLVGELTVDELAVGELVVDEAG